MSTHNIGFGRELMDLECHYCLLLGVVLKICGKRKTGNKHFLLFLQGIDRCNSCGDIAVTILRVATSSYTVNSLPNIKIIVWYKLKAFADNNVAKVAKFVFIG